MRKTNLPDAFTALIVGLTLALLLLVVSLLVTGCVSVTMLDAGGRDTSISFYGYKSGANDLRATPEIEGGGTVRDAFTDLLKGLPLDGADLSALLENVGDAASKPPLVVPAAEPVIVPVAAPAPNDAVWHSEPRDVALPAGDWLVRFDIDGIEAEPKSPDGRSDCEHFFADIRGDGFDRVLLANMCNEKSDGSHHARGLRVIVDDGEKRMFDHDRPASGAARISIERSAERLLVSLDSLLWLDAHLNGDPTSIVIGGGKERDRSFRGRWRNLLIVPQS